MSEPLHKRFEALHDPEAQKRSVALLMLPFRIFGWFILGIFTIVTLGVFVFVSVILCIKLAQASRWTPQECVITKSELDRRRYDAPVLITYTYQFQGRAYSGDRYTFIERINFGYDWKSRCIGRYPVGLRTVCYLDPNNPSRAVLERTPDFNLLGGLIGIPFVLFALVFRKLFSRIPVQFLLGADPNALPRRAREHSFRKSSNASRHTPPPAMPAANSGAAGRSDAGRHVRKNETVVPGNAGQEPLELKAEPRGGVKLIPFILFTASFAAIVGTLQVVLLSDMPRTISASDWLGIAVFAIIDCLILACIGYVVYRLLCLANPVPLLTLTPATLYRGAETRVSWTLAGGNCSAMRSLVILIKARERVVYSNNGETHEKQEEIFSQTMFASIENKNFSNGFVAFKVPMTAIPSFEATNNKIEWRIVVKGKLRAWPGINASFPVVVYPYRPVRQS